MHRGLLCAGRNKTAQTSLGDQYICNFSVFNRCSIIGRSAGVPDPSIHRPRADRNGMVIDITCDSDGKVSKFIDLQDVRDTLPLHRITPGGLLSRRLPRSAPIGTSWATCTICLDASPSASSSILTKVRLVSGGDRRQPDWRSCHRDSVGQSRLMRLLKTQVDAAIKTDRLKPNDAMKLPTTTSLQNTLTSLNGAKPPPQPGNWLR